MNAPPPETSGGFLEVSFEKVTKRHEGNLSEVKVPTTTRVAFLEVSAPPGRRDADRSSQETKKSFHEAVLKASQEFKDTHKLEVETGAIPSAKNGSIVVETTWRGGRGGHLRDFSCLY